MKELLTADERASLVGWLDLQRSFVRPRCEGLSEIVANVSLDDVEQAVFRESGAASTRYILCHLVEETARHLGHLDILRELLDGHRG